MTNISLLIDTGLYEPEYVEVVIPEHLRDELDGLTEQLGFTIIAETKKGSFPGDTVGVVEFLEGFLYEVRTKKDILDNAPEEYQKITRAWEDVQAMSLGVSGVFDTPADNIQKHILNVVSINESAAQHNIPINSLISKVKS